jgi:hypothetical protein
MRILLLVTVVLLAGIAALLAVQTFDHPPDIWSYAVLTPKDEDLMEDLNKAGALGWEVVFARRATRGEGASSSTFSYEMILKRRGAAHLTELTSK